MADEDAREKEARAERARQLHEQIERMKSGKPLDTGLPKSIKEQVDERSEESEPEK